MRTAVGILLGTPPWVWALLILVTWLGLLSARERVAHLARILITPAVFIAWGSFRLVSHSAAEPGLYLDWLGGAVLGGVAGAMLVQLGGLQADRAARRVRMPGHWLPLARNLAIFGAKYAIGVLTAMQALPLQELAPWDFGVSGAAAGYFLGWLTRFALAYRAAPPLGAEPAPEA